jgi:tRNA(His) 5'-end guanylyltransferase
MRLDGKAFHTYTRGLDKPFDEGLIEDMRDTATYLCSKIEGAKCAYVQSDEISILITDYVNLKTQAWFDYSVQKMTSISASLCTAKFNQLRISRVNDWGKSEESNYGEFILESIDNMPLAFFDSRVFNIPKEEVPNYFHARQRDAVKNSISMLGQSLYSHKELHKKSGDEVQELCFQKGHNWNDLHYSKKRGSFIVKQMTIDGQLVDSHTEIPLDSVVRWFWGAIETPMTLNDPNIYKQHNIRL